MEALHRLEVLAVDIGLAKLQGAHHLEGILQSLGIDGRGEAILAVVCPSDCLVDRVVSDDRQYGTEGLLMHDVHLLCHLV